MFYFAMAAIFVLGYILIAFEHSIHVDKAASALLTATVLWVLLVIGADSLLADNMANLGEAAEHLATGKFDYINAQLGHHLAEIAEILFFLMGNMVIVELIDSHDGFAPITRRIQTTSATKLLWIIGTLTFVLSALLVNLTTTIVMISLLRKLVTKKELRLWLVGIVVLCSNSGGAWSPVGDVTTTMLWIGNQVTAGNIIVELIIPSIVSALVPMIILSIKFKGITITRPSFDDKPLKKREQLSSTPFLLAANINKDLEQDNLSVEKLASQAQQIVDESQLSAEDMKIKRATRQTVLAIGLIALAMVPFFKTITHLPPYIGVMFGLSILWIFTEVSHKKRDDFVKQQVTVLGVLKRVDMPSILFFLGILLAVSALATAGILHDMGIFLDKNFGNLYVINIIIGLLSSLVDNVPLVAGAMQMYPLLDESALTGLQGAELARQSMFVQNGQFWNFLAYCAGTGGSCLIIGSASGVVAMGMEKMSFSWYLKNISWLAVAGYLAGAVTYLLMYAM